MRSIVSFWIQPCRLLSASVVRRTPTPIGIEVQLLMHLRVPSCGSRELHPSHHADWYDKSTSVPCSGRFVSSSDQNRPPRSLGSQHTDPFPLNPRVEQQKPTVVVASSTGQPPRTVKDVLQRAGVGEAWRAGDAIFLKPNLTYPEFRPGVTTRVEFIVAVAEYFLDKGCRITVGEGPGGYNGFSMKAAFEAHGLNAACGRLGIPVVELSDWETEHLGVQTKRGAALEVPVPKPLLRDFRAVVSLPVPKVHCMTGVSLGLKNLWGCITDRFRIRFHPFLDEIVAQLATSLPIGGVALDGLYGLDRNGPMVDGLVRRLEWTAASEDCGAHDLAIAQLLGMDPFTVSHLRYGMEVGVVPSMDRIDLESIGLEQQHFSLKPNLWNRVAKLTWLHPTLTWLVYLSPFAGPIHWLMYLFRSRPKELAVRTLRGWDRPTRKR